MPALAEHRTRTLLERSGVSLVEATLVVSPEGLPRPAAWPVFVKAQVPGATSRRSSGLVRRAGSWAELEDSVGDLLRTPGCEGVLVARGVDIAEEHYAAVVLDCGSTGSPPGGRLLWSGAGGSGVETRSSSLAELRFPLSSPPSSGEIAAMLPEGTPAGTARALEGMVAAFLEYRLLVLEANPLAVLDDGTVTVVDCRAEYEERAVRREDEALFREGCGGSGESTRLERIVEEIDRLDPAGTGFFRQSRADAPPGAIRVATNLCGGGGKMLWEMAVGGRGDIFQLNESDTSGGLSAFKSYRILRVVLSQEDADVLVFTGSGMAFQSQLYIAAAVWKALRESPRIPPVMIRFGGTDEERAAGMLSDAAPGLRTRVAAYPSEVFPNVMVDDMRSFVDGSPPSSGAPPPVPRGVAAFEVENPPGAFLTDAALCSGCADSPCVGACPTGFLQPGPSGAPSPVPGRRCIGCLLCEAACIREGRGGLFIRLDIPEVE